MATKSITKNVVIRDRAKCRSLLRALDGSSSSRAPVVSYQRPHSDMSTDDMKKIFGGNDDRLSRG